MRLVIRTLAVLSLVSSSAAQEAPDFATEVRPLLSRRCFACHGPDAQGRKAGLRLDTREGALAAIVPGDPDGSLLLERISAAHEGERMPPQEAAERLPDHQVELLRRWIADGAPYSEHWAFVVPERPAQPEVSDPGWVRNPIDAFLLARLDAEGLTPSQPATRAQLARRVSLDLIGLPPTPEEVQAFEADPAPDAYERYVDRLLASPHYGERWARVWLDVARYADSAGLGSDPLRTIWRYRDWVIDAFNSNQPYDEFTRDQLAGDLLPDATLEQRLATAFHRNTKTNTEGGTDDEEWRVEAVKDRTDTTMQAWMGLTYGCAKCHTHKYDPIEIEEYYGLFAFFNQTVDSDKNDDRPRLRTPSRDQLTELQRLEDERAGIEAQLAQPLDAEAVARWIAGAREREASWQRLKVTDASSAAGAQLSVVDDIVTAGGEAAERDTYTVTFELPTGTWRGLELAAHPDPNLPGNGPGRSPGNGNFVITDLTLERAPDPNRPAPTGRLVRFELPGPGRILSLAEVQVLAGGVNVAQARPATQSSTGYNGPAELAVDGNTSGVYTDGSVTHTGTEADPWWEVDLGADVAIERIAFWNRSDGNLHTRLDGVVVRVLDGERRTVWSARVRRTEPTETSLHTAEWAQELLLAEATADFEQTDFSAAATLDGDANGTGWAIGGAQGQGHRLVLALAEPFTTAAPTALRLSIAQNFGTVHTLGSFGLRASEYGGPARALPVAVAAAISALPSCTDEQQALLADHARQVDPDRALLRGESERLAKAVEDLNVVTTPVLEELPADRRRTTHVLHKGNFLEPEAEVSATVPKALHAWPEGAPLDRLGLSRWITAPANPLTARGAVNRWWMTLFGRGLVETQEDFGSQGLPPTHPELLDWLAVEYRESGWDTKALLRTIVTSNAYRQSSRATPASLAGDPHGRLYSRMPRVQLEAEQVRDQALAAAGLLSLEQYGPSVFPPQPDGIWQAAFNGQRSWQTSMGEDRYRRGLYVFWRRTAPYPSMEAFDAPSRETCTLRRQRTNTPLQVFVTLNDPVYVEAAQALARRMMAEGGETAAGRVARGFELCLLREPTAEEREVLLALYVDALTELAQRPESEALDLSTKPLGDLPEGTDPRIAAAWTSVAGVLLNLDAFLNRE
ncbi:MAG: DUF1553 domain-containing protein [Planctomycetota bacterium]|nr:DUF1553 domain-containing protein [Planctomycetota bacterium]